MKKRKLSESFNVAIEGIIYTLKSQKNMRLHFLLAAGVVLLAVALNLEKIEIVLLLIAITIVLITEMFNTAVERVLDIVTPEFHPQTRIIKDIVAGCVLLAAVSSVIIGYLVFSRFLIDFSLERLLARVQYSPWHITFVSIFVVILAVILGKVLSKKGRPLRGGMPSGHAAVAFAIWTSIVLITRNELVSLLALIMAGIIAQSRLRRTIHTRWEVVAGSILGVLATLLCFQIFGQII
jgi:diacylglycerol kinase (ATP)